MPQIDLVKLAIFMATLAMSVGLLIFLFNLMNVPNDLPVEVISVINWIISSAYYLDFLLPIKMMFQLLFWTLASNLILYVADGALFAWKQIAKIRS
jgi:hypothetical protein